jgi:membrane-bound acyltransferase YfiQ involved in biofilm formation
MKLPGFTSQGHAMAISIYIIINVILTFVNASNAEQESHLARRLGWMAILNMAFLFFLALKNTPLAFLTAYSYERLNGLHQIVGYTTILYTVIHAM